MKFPFYIAKRYLFSKKSRNVINIITGISMITICIVTAALIILLSAFNGLEKTVISLFTSFDPDIKITAVEGKSFELSDSVFTEISNIPELKYLSKTIEESALLTANEKQHIGLVKGVDSVFLKMVRLDTMLIEGSAVLEDENSYYAILGEGVASNLAINIYAPGQIITAYYPKRGKVNLFDPFRKTSLSPSGIFYLQQEYNYKYVLVPLAVAETLFDYDNQFTALEVQVQDKKSISKVQKQLKTILGPDFYVKNQFQQHELMYKVMKAEKLAVFLIVTFVLIIASFNIIGALTMLVVEKRKDVMVLWSMGADFNTIKRIFILEGTLASVIGAISGIVIGVAVVLLQLKFEWVKLGNFEGAMPYPVDLQIIDVFIAFFTVLIIGFIASWLRMKSIQFHKGDHHAFLK